MKQWITKLALWLALTFSQFHIHAQVTDQIQTSVGNVISFHISSFWAIAVPSVMRCRRGHQAAHDSTASDIC